MQRVKSFEMVAHMSLSKATYSISFACPVRVNILFKAVFPYFFSIWYNLTSFDCAATENMS